MTGILMMSVGNSYGSLPVNTVAPVVSGTATVGQTLTTTNGTWLGAPAPTFTYQWQRSGSNISGATSSTYVLVSADQANTIRCVVTATNPLGAVSANSNSTASVTALPVNTVAPVVSGTVQVGQTLSTTNGTWTGTPTPTFAYQWQRGASNIGGATSSTYVIQSADIGSTIRCVVTATNTVGSASANSNSTIAVPDVFWIATTSAYGNGSRMARNQATSAGLYITTQGSNAGNQSLFLTSAGAISGIGRSPGSGFTLFPTLQYGNYPLPQNGGFGSTEYSATVDTANEDMYAAGGTSSGKPGLVKVNSSGTLQWFRPFNLDTNGGAFQLRDSAGNLWIGQQSNSSSGNTSKRGNFVKVSAAGDTITAFRSSTPSDRTLGPGGMAVDSSNNFYFSINEGATPTNTVNPTFTTIIKTDITGSAVAWQRQIVASNTQTQPAANYRMLGYQDGVLVQISRRNNNNDTGSPTHTQIAQYLVRFDGSGNVLWKRAVVLGGSPGVPVNEQVGDLHVDAAGNIWWTMKRRLNLGPPNFINGDPQIIIHRIDPNGNLLVHRMITTADAGLAGLLGGSITTSGSSYYLSLRTTGSGSCPTVAFKLPIDGSKTGTYGPWVYTSAATGFGGDSELTITSVTRFSREGLSASLTGDTVSNATFAPTVASLVNV